jgi:CRISPR system Cascade subunit CasE
MSDGLRIVRLVLDRREAARVAARHRLPAWVDDGYFLHATLAQLFATSSAPVELPFETFAYDDSYAAEMGDPSLLYVLAYSREDETTLLARLGPARERLLRKIEVRDAPALSKGQRAVFRCRVCPIVRTKLAGNEPLRADKKGRARSRELDAFLHRAHGVAKGAPIQREDVYREWFAAQLAHEPGACTLDEAKLVEFRREQMRRRARDASARIERPNALLEGTLTVGEPDAFARLLARGIGRHRAFGFGMLLLRPAR